MQHLLLFLSFLGVTVADDYYGGGPRPRPPAPRPPVPRPPVSGARCPNNWMAFDRPQGRWCIGVFHDTGSINQPTAEGECRKKGAVLTGYQNTVERMAIANAAREVLQKFNLGEGAMWLGARRKLECPRTGYCPWYSTFRWTDGHTTGNGGFGFSHGQPDGAVDARWGVQDCVHQFVYPYSETSARWPGIMHGSLDDQHCLQATRDPSRKLYACGRRP